MGKIIKLLGWIKGNWMPIVSIITAIIIAVGAIQTWRANYWQKEHLRLEGKLEEQRADQDKLWAEALKKDGQREIEKAVEQAERERLEARIQRVIREGEMAKRALEREKQRTATLPPTELVAQINERIGEESSLTAGGLFLFTRTGANRTLDRFKDGEFHLSEYTRLKGAMTDHDAEVASFNVSLGECEATQAANLTGWDDCRETLGTALDDIDTLKKVSKASVWRGRKQGAFWTIIIGGGLKLLGVW